MTPARRPHAQRSGGQAAVQRAPLWYADWPMRLRALLPELTASIVAATCLTTVISLEDGASLVTVLLVSALVQVVTQSLMYLCVYVMNSQGNPWLPYVAVFLLLAASFTLMPLAQLVALSCGTPSEGLILSVFVGTVAGVTFFLLTRMRFLFVCLIVELLVFADLVDKTGGLLPVHVVFFASVATLYVMRSSAARMTVPFEANDLVYVTPGEEDGEAPSLGLFAQIAGVAAVAAALCMMVSLVSLPLVMRSSGTQDSPYVLVDSRPEVGIDGLPALEAITGQGSSDAGVAESASADGAPHAAVSGRLVCLVLLALLVLPFAACLGRRALAKSRIQREPQPGARAARLYLGIIARVAAAGAERDEAETPTEFLLRCGEELGGLVAPAGMGPEDWAAITDTYEKVRYAGMDPTEEELARCWRMYDALPACTRRRDGWLRYMTGAFWRM